MEKAKLTDTLGLRSLGLGFNDINADGITAIVKALTPNHLIQTLSIRGNIINAQVVKDIGEMLRLDLFMCLSACFSLIEELEF